MRKAWFKRGAAILLLCGATGGIVAYLGRAMPTGPASGTQFSAEADSPSPRRSLRIATFNIDGGRGLDDKIDLDRTAKSLQRPDFVGLNEVHGSADGNQATDLGRLLDLPYLFVPSERRWGHDSFGNAVFSRLPIRKWERVPLPSARWHALRNYLLTEADWDGKPIWFLTTHIDFKVGGEEQKAIVIDKFLSLPTPCVLMGDLNSPPADPAIRRLSATPGVQEAISSIAEEKPGKVRVDWIFLRGLKTVDASPADISASDHPAYWAEVRRER